MFEKLTSETLEKLSWTFEIFFIFEIFPKVQKWFQKFKKSEVQKGKSSNFRSTFSVVVSFSFVNNQKKHFWDVFLKKKSKTNIFGKKNFSKINKSEKKETQKKIEANNETKKTNKKKNCKLKIQKFLRKTWKRNLKKKKTKHKIPPFFVWKRTKNYPTTQHNTQHPTQPPTWHTTQPPTQHPITQPLVWVVWVLGCWLLFDFETLLFFSSRFFIFQVFSFSSFSFWVFSRTKNSKQQTKMLTGSLKTFLCLTFQTFKITSSKWFQKQGLQASAQHF